MSLHLSRIVAILTPGPVLPASFADLSQPSMSFDLGSHTLSLHAGFWTLDKPPASPVPEPGTLALLLAGLCVIGWIARRRG